VCAVSDAPSTHQQLPSVVAPVIAQRCSTSNTAATPISRQRGGTKGRGRAAFGGGGAVMGRKKGAVLRIAVDSGNEKQGVVSGEAGRKRLPPNRGDKAHRKER